MNIPNLPFSKEELKTNIEQGFVTVRPHFKDELFIFNYTAKAQYEREWNEVTQTCRGLILDNQYRIVARPFRKIFNYTEVVPDKIIFQQPPVVNDKLDGSLGIAYWSQDGWAIATRGSFVSEQAEWATHWLNTNFPDYDQSPNITCLFEIIYPDNRICVSYGDRAELVLIAAINNENGADYPLQAVSWWKGSVVDQITGPSNIDEAYMLATSNAFENKEGVVCTWHKYNEPSFRFKIKHPEYVRLHKIIHTFSKRKIWEVLSTDGSLLKFIDSVPDEFYTLVRETKEELQSEFQAVHDAATADFEEIKHITQRKDFAAQAKKSKYSAILFKMFDNKDVDDLIWKMIKPEGDE